jgi:phospholipid transport system substrate-binding protein
MALIRRMASLIVLLAAALVPQPAATAPSPVDTVQRLHDALIAVMREADSLDVSARYRRLEPTLKAVYDFPTMIRLATGTAWTSATPEQRAALVEAFARLSIATYAQRFSGFSGQRFETLGERPGPRGTVLVDTRLIRPEDAPVSLTYVVQKQGEDWKIINVLVEGSISELAVRRSEYAQVLRQGGPDRLSEVLNAKADDLLAGKGD